MAKSAKKVVKKTAKKVVKKTAKQQKPPQEQGKQITIEQFRDDIKTNIDSLADVAIRVVPELQAANAKIMELQTLCDTQKKLISSMEKAAK